jgi:O-antigen ligase
MLAPHLLAPRVRRVSRIDPAWPLVLLTVGMPLAYLAGVSALVWVVPGVVFGLALYRSRSVAIPSAALPLAALAAWTLVTVVRLSGVGSVPLFLYRWLLWGSALATFLWLVNPVSVRVSTRRVVDLLAALWIVLLGFGFLALLFPHVEAPSILQQVFDRLLHHPLQGPSFLYDISVVRFAELQEFSGTFVPRPAAPMAYTNGWGSTMGLLAPFFAVSWLGSPGRLRRNVGIALAALAVIPIVISTNRGLWLSLGAAVAYLAIRFALRGDLRMILGVALVGSMLVVVALATPLHQSITSRFSGAEASNETRSRLYDTALEKTKESPLLGNGAPESTGDGPAIGTHGLMWYVMFSHGFPAVVLLFAAAATLLVATFRAQTRIAMAAHLSIVVFAVQIPFYGLFPQIVLIGVAAGVAWRENHPTRPLEVAR